MEKVKIVVQDSEETMEVEATTRKFPGKTAVANQILTLISHPPASSWCLLLAAGLNLHSFIFRMLPSIKMQ